MEKEKSEYKIYLMVFGATLSLFLTVLLVAAFYVQPLEGELTRLGSYAERDFGWNLPQKKIRGNARLIKRYDDYSDVLIIGDSFSTNGVWQPFFQQYTGFSYVTLNIRETSLPDLLESNPFRKYPPKIIIMQCVERELLYFFKNMNLICNGKTGNNFRKPVKGIVEQPAGEYYEEKRKTFDLLNINLKYAASVIVNTITRSISSRDSHGTKKLLLTNETLFSNKKSGEILIYEGDMEKLRWKQEDVNKALCSVKGLQERIQSNGKTLFIFMLAPDKSTAYAEYMVSPEFRSIFQINQLLVDFGVNAPRIDRVVKDAIRRGEKDIYSPSGTHWSARGYALAAEEVASFIRDRMTLSWLKHM